MNRNSFLREEERRERYIEMFQGVPDALFVLSGGVRNIAHPLEEPAYISTDYSDSDPYGMLAGKARVDATAEVSHYFPEVKIVTTTHSPSVDNSRNISVVHAYVLVNELKQLGVPEAQIMTEVKSIDTLTELQEMVKLIARHKWQRVGIITFELHIERTARMLAHLKELSGLLDQELKEGLEYIEREKPAIVIVKAEDILLQLNSHYQHLIEHARTTSSYQRRVESERKGREAIENRTYRPTGETWKITSEREEVYDYFLDSRDGNDELSML